MIEAFAPAKINLTLHVTGKREDGYHLLDSLVVFGDIGDRLILRDADRLSLRVTGPFAQGVPDDDSNLVLRAAKLLKPKRGAEITLEKHLPHGAGIGGGSSDAAAALKALAELWGVAPISQEAALTLGADVPVCLRAPEPTFMSGIGEVLRPAPKLPPLWLVLINPNIAISTAEVFRTLTETHGVDNPKMDRLDGTYPDEDAFWVWLAGQRNDLSPCVCDMVPEVANIIAQLWNIDSCQDADMSGSGSTCRGVFATQSDADQAAADLRAANPDWWVKVTKVS